LTVYRLRTAGATEAVLEYVFPFYFDAFVTSGYTQFVVLEIIKYGHPVLRQKGKRIERVTPEICKLAADMLETMYAAEGLGLAAQQVGQSLLLTVIDVATADRPSQLFIDGKPRDLTTSMPLILINPQILNPEGEQVGSEGCLSIPDVNADIRRAERVTVRAQALDSQEIVFECTGLLARAAQHEIDHLNGMLFISRMDPATRVSFEGKLKKMEKETLAALPKTRKPRRSLAPHRAGLAS
jgi:peptide deformylase